MNPRLLLAVAAFGSSVWAQPLPGPGGGRAGVVVVEPVVPGAAEPEVRLSIVEDRSTRIEELRVRGQVTRISVRPAGGGAGYEVLPGRSLRDEVDNRSDSAGTAGKRVWRVMSF